MSWRDRCLALGIVLIWGVNFVVIKVGLEGVPPLMLAAMRFILVALLGVVLINRPQCPIPWVILYGLTISFGQFALLFWAISIGFPAGLASLLLQIQAFITVAMATVLYKERLERHHIYAAIIAALGVYILLEAQGNAVSLSGFSLILVISAATCWAMGNITNKLIMQRYSVSTLSLIGWSAIVPALAFSLSSFWIEGTTQITQAMFGIQWHNILSVVYLSLLATVVGYGGWSYLLSRYPTSQVAPLSLLVPVVGLFSAWLLLGEALTLWQLLGVGVIGLALVINTYGKTGFKRAFSLNKH